MLMLTTDGKYWCLHLLIYIVKLSKGKYLGWGLGRRAEEWQVHLKGCTTEKKEHIFVFREMPRREEDLREDT